MEILNNIASTTVKCKKGTFSKTNQENLKNSLSIGYCRADGYVDISNSVGSCRVEGYVDISNSVGSCRTMWIFLKQCGLMWGGRLCRYFCIIFSIIYFKLTTY